MDAFDAGDVAGGGDDTAFSAAYYDGFIADFRVVAFFNGGVESIAIHVGDGEGCELCVGQSARPSAFGAAGGCIKYFKAISAHGLLGHRGVLSQDVPVGTEG